MSGGGGTTAHPRSILVVDDDALVRRAFLRSSSPDARILVADSAAAAMQRVTEARFDAIVVDLVLGADSGVELIRELRRSAASGTLIAISGVLTTRVTVEAVLAGALHVLAKPFTAEDLAMLLDRAPVASQPPSRASLARVEWEYLNRVLGDAGGNRSLAARQLGITRTSLRRKLSKSPPPR